MNKVFFTADLHFGHANAIRFDNRPFSSVEEMDAEMMQRWNTKVTKDDIVYVLGDMIWKTRNNDAEWLVKNLNGQIILIKGNHDRFFHNTKALNALADIKDYADIPIKLEDGTTKRCILSHFFIPMYVGNRYGAIHLHGHSHCSQEAQMEVLIANMLNDHGIRHESYNVGCMYWDYSPVTLDEILRKRRLFHKVKSVECLPDFQLFVHFEENTEKVYSIKKLCEVNAIFNSLLNNPSLFYEAKVDKGGFGVIWNDELDISCNELWENGIE